MTLPEALAESCDTYFYEIGNRFYEGGSESRVRMQQWARRFGFGGPTGLDIGGEADGLVPTPEWRQEDVRERLGPRLEPGRLDPARDRPEGPPRHAAADGGVLRDARERREHRHALPRLERRAARRKGVAASRAAPLRAARRRSRQASTPRRSRAVRDGLYLRDALGERHVVGRLRQLLGADLGQDGNGGEGGASFPGYPSDHLEDQSWWCGWGPSDSARLVVCALIENGGHGSSAAAPAALRVFERFFGVEAPPAIVVDTD